MTIFNLAGKIIFLRLSGLKKHSTVMLLNSLGKDRGLPVACDPPDALRPQN